MHYELSVMNYKNYDCVILGNGDFPTHDIPLAILKGCRYLCCCDHAAEEAARRGCRIDAVVGDGDSLSAAFKSEHADILHIVEEQEDNDQTKATRFCAGKGMRRIAYLGFTGKREDHTLGNISHLTDYTRDFGIQPMMVTDHGIFIPAQGRSVFETVRGQQASVFNVSCSRLVSSGLKWQTRPFSRLWEGTLNEALGDTITIDGDGSYLVYMVFQ